MRKSHLLACVHDHFERSSRKWRQIWLFVADLKFTFCWFFSLIFIGVILSLSEIMLFYWLQIWPFWGWKSATMYLLKFRFERFCWQNVPRWVNFPQTHCALTTSTARKQTLFVVLRIDLFFPYWAWSSQNWSIFPIGKLRRITEVIENSDLHGGFPMLFVAIKMTFVILVLLQVSGKKASPRLIQFSAGEGELKKKNLLTTIAQCDEWMGGWLCDNSIGDWIRKPKSFNCALKKLHNLLECCWQ